MFVRITHDAQSFVKFALRRVQEREAKRSRCKNLCRWPYGGRYVHVVFCVRICVYVKKNVP